MIYFSPQNAVCKENSMSKQYFEFKRKGLCIRCGGKRDSEKTRCSDCHQKHLDYQEKFKKEAIAAGLCRYCAVRPRTEGKSMCSECLEKHSERQKALYASWRSQCIQAYGGRCACCKVDVEKYLQLDHVESDGAAHRKEISFGRGGSMYKWAVKNNFPNRLQLLCANCHNAKTTNGGCSEEDHCRMRLIP